MDCPICCSPTTAPCTCPHCQYACCAPCVQSYLSQPGKAMTCLNKAECGKPWNTEFILRQFLKPADRKWIYEKAVSDLLVLEKAMLPDTQHEARVVSAYYDVREEIAALPTNADITRLTPKDKHAIAKGIATRNEDKARLTAIARKHHAQSILLCDGANIPKPPPAAPTYMFPCPVEACRGFVDATFTCGTCRAEFCAHCHEPAVGRHSCNPDTVATVASIRKETRPCPRCKVPIFKISGCSQMFCTAEDCHTVFDWETGHIVTGHVHNPHYFEHLRSNAVTPNQDRMRRLQDHLQRAACGGYSLDHIPQDVFSDMVGSVDRPESDIAAEVYQRVMHFMFVIRNHLSENQVRGNMDLRVRYLFGEISEEQWKHTLLHRLKLSLKIHAHRDLVESAVLVYTDLFYMLVGKKCSRAEAYTQMMHWSRYAADRLRELEKIYQGTAPIDRSDVV